MFHLHDTLYGGGRIEHHAVSEPEHVALIRRAQRLRAQAHAGLRARIAAALRRAASALMRRSRDPSRDRSRASQPSLR